MAFERLIIWPTGHFKEMALAYQTNAVERLSSLFEKPQSSTLKSVRRSIFTVSASALLCNYNL